MQNLELEDDVVPTIAILIIKDNKVLLVKHKEAAKHLNGTYGLPSGRLEKGETEKEASIRELLEETGLRIKEEDLVEFPNNLYIATLERKGGSLVKFSWKVLLCINYDGDIKESDETIPRWIEISKLKFLNLLPNIENAVEAGLEYTKNSKL